jgi:hypothetical protein
MDFYDPDIEERLNKLELEEDKMLEMEDNEKELMEDEEEVNEDGVTEEDLRRALKDVRGKKIILKMKHKLKSKLRAKSKNKDLKEM